MVLNLNIISDGVTRNKPGSPYICYMVNIPRRQSRTNSDMLEKNLKKWIELNPDFELLSCGCRVRDLECFDLLWYNDMMTTIFYRELKANIELDMKNCLAMMECIIIYYPIC